MRSQCVIIALVAVFGCGGEVPTAAPKTPSNAAATPTPETSGSNSRVPIAADNTTTIAASDAKPAAVSAREKPASEKDEPVRPPATVEEAARVLDLRKFPVMDKAEFHNRSLAKLIYQMPGDVKGAFEFQKQKLVSAGWKELPNGYAGAESVNGIFQRDGYKLSVSAFSLGKDMPVSVTLIAHGNVNTAKLPTPDGVKPFYSTAINTGYLTEDAVDKTTAKVRELLLAQGWEPYGTAGDSMHFKQNAIQLSARVSSAPAQGNKTFIDYSTELLSADIPAPANAEQVQYSDSPTQLSLDVPGSRDDAAEFYRAALGKHGWEPTTEQPVKTDFTYFLIFRNKQKDLMEINFRDLPEKQQTRLMVRFQTAEEVAEMDRRIKEQLAKKKEAENKPKPKLAIALPKDAGKIETMATRIEFTVAIGKAKSAVDAIRKQLTDAGWKEADGKLEAMFGTVSLTKDGQSVSLTYVETGLLAPEITIDATGVELERAK